MPIDVDVALLPRDVNDTEHSVCIVIDALRATSSVATIFARGAREVIVAGSIEEARTLRGELPDALLCGEAGGLPPDGFDHGNSPLEFATLELTGRRLILATSNGTRALSGLRVARRVFTGSLPNLTACSGSAVGAVRDGDSLTIVCSGTELGTRFSLEDTVVAGAVVQRIDAMRQRGSTRLSDAALAALRLWMTYQDRPRSAFDDAVHGRVLIALGMGADLDACARVDAYDVVPELRVEEGRLVLRSAPRR